MSNDVHKPNPAVSVIIPAYNCAQLLPQAVESVRKQTYQDFEVIIVDDGSEDETWDVIKSISADWDKVRAFRIPHRGPAAARNRGIAEMKGKWIALLDADDLWLPEKLARCMEYLAKHPDISIVYTPMKPIRLDGKEMKGHTKPCFAGQLTRKLFKSIFIHTPSTVFHKRVIEQCGAFDESLSIAEDYEYWLRVSTKFEFGLIDEPLAIRRWRPTSLTRSNRLKGRITKAKILERFYFEGGGKEYIPEKEAFKRLSEVHYKAGKILLHEGNYQDAIKYLTKAIKYNPNNIKARIFCLIAQLHKA